MKFSFEEEKHGKLSFADAQVAEKKTLTSFFPFLENCPFKPRKTSKSSQKNRLL